MPPTAADSAAILRKLFGVTSPAGDDDGPVYGDPTGSLSLAQARGSRETELETRIANDAFGKGDPNTGRDVALLRFLKGEQAADPYTGHDATERTHHIEDNLDAASLYDRPEMTKMRRDQLADKERLATGPARVTGEYGLRHQALENEGALERQRVASQGLIDAAGTKAGGGSHMAAGTLERVAGASNVVAGLDRLRQLKPKVSIGPAAGRMQRFLQGVPLVATDENFDAFNAETSNIENNLLHTLSGAAVTPTEQERLRQQIPLATDKDGVWEQKANALERSMRGLNKRIELLAAGVSPDVLDRIPVEQLADQAGGAPAAAPGGASEVQSIQRSGTGNAFGDLLNRADRAATRRGGR